MRLAGASIGILNLIGDGFELRFCVVVPQCHRFSGARKSETPANVHLPRMFKAKEVRKFAVVAAVV